MIGSEEPKKQGLYWYTVNEVFKRLEERQGVISEWRVKVSVVEIYNEQIRDLLPRKGDPI